MKKIPFLFLLIPLFLCVSCFDEWSDAAPDPMTWDEAVKYCDELENKGYDDWYLPTIDELRMRITNCPATEPGGSCPVSRVNQHLTWDDLKEEFGCGGCNDGENHSYQGKDSGWYWSSSARSKHAIVAFRVNFDTGAVGNYNKDHKFNVRCFRDNSHDLDWDWNNDDDE